MSVLKIENYTKIYGGNKKACDNVSLSVESGDIFGFIGHNGAGKSTTIRAVVGVMDFDEGTIEIGRQYLSNYKKHGYCTWYRWAIDNWGTKWNACNVSVGKSSIYLDTAWSFPAPIFAKLSEICHKNNVVMSGYFCDEDYMSGNKGYFHSGDDHNTEGIEYLDCTDLEDEDFKEIFINCLGEDWYEEALEYQRGEEDEAV